MCSPQEGKTALHHAVDYASIDRDFRVVQLLIDLGADVNLKENVCKLYVFSIHVCTIDKH